MLQLSIFYNPRPRGKKPHRPCGKSCFQNTETRPVRAQYPHSPVQLKKTQKKTRFGEIFSEKTSLSERWSMTKNHIIPATFQSAAKNHTADWCFRRGKSHIQIAELFFCFPPLSVSCYQDSETVFCTARFLSFTPSPGIRGERTAGQRVRPAVSCQIKQ